MASLEWGKVRSHAITSLDQLEALVGTPAETSLKKESAGLSPLEAAYIAASPFFLLATSNPDGTCDVSPRGDPAGSVVVIDQRTLVIPDRKGNKRVDSLRNIVLNPQVGLLFLVPGMEETLRINGRATLTADETLRASLAIRNITPDLVLVVETEQVFMHCARAFKRSQLWDPATWPNKDDVPNMADVLHAKLHLEGTVEELWQEREERYLSSLY